MRNFWYDLTPNQLTVLKGLAEMDSARSNIRYCLHYHQLLLRIRFLTQRRRSEIMVSMK